MTILICAFIQSTSIAVEQVDVYMEKAQNFLLLNKYKEAIFELNKAYSLSDDQKRKAKIENAIGWAYFSLGNISESRRYLSSAFDSASKIGDKEIAQRASNNLGVLEFNSGNLVEAKKYFEGKFSKSSKTSDSYLKLINRKLTHERVNEIIANGVFYRSNKDFDKALEEYEKALLIEPNNINALEYKGYALFRLGDYNSAIDVLKYSHELNPSRINIVINLIKSYCAINDIENARKLAKDEAKLINSLNLLQDGEFCKSCGKSFFDNL